VTRVQLPRVGSPARRQSLLRARQLAARQWNALDTVTFSLRPTVRAMTSYVITQLHDLVFVVLFIGNSYVSPLEITTIATVW